MLQIIRACALRLPGVRLVRPKPHVDYPAGWDKLADLYRCYCPRCLVCGKVCRVDVHHIVPLHVDRSRGLDPTNLIGLCPGTAGCHLLVGHLGQWVKWNATLRPSYPSTRLLG
jgi:5-methylcytosine-specific restriction endonuclease McrA